MAIKIFVVWDRTTQAISNTLESLARRPPPELEFAVPMLTPAGGELLRDRVVKGISAADRVLVVVDKPNANVGFETGLAFGLGREVALVVQRHPRPSWLSEPPFANFLVQSIDGPGAIKRVLTQDIWHRIVADATAHPRDGEGASDPTLFLCPSRYEGEAFEAEQRSIFPNWRTMPDFSFGFNDLPSLTSGVQRLIWTVAHFGEGADERDGGENAGNGVVAGWFFAKTLQRYGGELNAEAMRELRRSFHVLRSSEARQVVDVETFEKPFRGLEEYRARLGAVPPPASDVTADQALQPRQEVLDILRKLLSGSVSLGGLFDIASDLAPDGALVKAITPHAPNRPEMIATLLDALAASNAVTPELLRRITVLVPGSGQEIERCERLLGASSQPSTAYSPRPSTSERRPTRMTLGGVLGAAHKLDRTIQWAQVLEQCTSGHHSLFLLRGESSQGLGLFLERLNLYLSEKVPNHRVYNIPFRIEHEKAESGADWERRLSYALAPRKDGNAAGHLADAARNVSLFLVLGLQPLHDLTPTQEEGLLEFLKVNYPALLMTPGISNPVHMLVPIDYDAGADSLVDSVDAAALEGENQYNAQIGRQIEGRLVHYVRLKPVTFPTWDEVQDYLFSQRPRPQTTTIARIQLDYDRISGAPGGTFLALAERLDRHLGEI